MITAAVMALEAWTLLAKPDVPLDLHQRPSEAPDRQEVVSLLGEAGRWGCSKPRPPNLRRPPKSSRRPACRAAWSLLGRL